MRICMLAHDTLVRGGGGGIILQRPQVNHIATTLSSQALLLAPLTDPQAVLDTPSYACVCASAAQRIRPAIHLASCIVCWQSSLALHACL